MMNRSLILQLGCLVLASLALQQAQGRATAPSPRLARIHFVGSSKNSSISGSIFMLQLDSSSSVHASGSVNGLKPGRHGFHVHEVGSTADGCVAAGAHFNPRKEEVHGGPGDVHRHVGDLGNIHTPKRGLSTTVDVADDVITLFGDIEGIVGRTVVIHEGEDDLGGGGTPGSLATGNAGSRVGCGIVELLPINEETKAMLSKDLRRKLNYYEDEDDDEDDDDDDDDEEDDVDDDDDDDDDYDEDDDAEDDD